MQKHVFGEDIQAMLSPLQRIGRCKQRKNIMFGALDLLSFTPDPALARDIRALVDVIRAHVAVKPTTKPPYIPLEEKEGVPHSFGDFFDYVRTRVHLTDIESFSDIEDFNGVSEMESLIMIANAVVMERDLRLCPEDLETLESLLEVLEYASSDIDNPQAS